jgi:hypothetical protein
VEVSGFDADAFCPADMLARIAAIFRPGSLSVSLSVDAASRCGGYAWGTLAAPPVGYGCQSATAQELATGGRVSYYTFGPDPDAAVSAAADRLAGTTLDGAAAASAAPTRSPSSGVAGVLRHMPSFSSAPSSALDSGSCGDDRSVASSGDDSEAAARAARAAALAWAEGLGGGAAEDKGAAGAAAAAVADVLAAAARQRRSMEVANHQALLL